MTSSQWLLLGLVVLLFTSGCLRPVRDLYPEQKEDRPISVYIISHGWHVEVAFKGTFLKKKIPDHEKLPEGDYLMVGWGDRKYYTADRAGVGLFLRAAFLPTRSVIHVAGLREAPDLHFSDSDIVEVRVSKAGLESMTDYMANQFSYGTSGRLKFAEDGHYENSAFFEAKGLYFFPKTSNKWVARVLRESGFPITPFYAITSGNVMHHAGK